MSLWPLLVLLLSVAWAEHAFAYYDPGVQRWINRDPIAEAGGKNTYAFSGGNPLSRMDAFGHSPINVPSMPPLGNPGGIVAACRCRNLINRGMHDAERWANETWGVPGNMHANSGSPADMLTHCVGACEVAKGEKVCEGSGINPRQYLQDRENGGVLADDKLDLENNKVGFGLAGSATDCKAGCVSAMLEGKLWTKVNGEAQPYVPPAPQFKLLSK